MTGINPRSGEKRVNINRLGERPSPDCKTVYPGSIPGVASTPHPAYLRRGRKSATRRGAVAALSKRERLCYMRAFIAPSRLFPGSSAVEQPAVNRLVAGSNPARGAK